MRKLFWVILAGFLSPLAGCSEFVTTGERTTAVDVVGEPSDMTPDSMKPADILGSALPMPDDADLITDSSEVRRTPKSLPEDLIDPLEGDAEPDVAGGLGLAKPVSLKATSRDTKSVK